MTQNIQLCIITGQPLANLIPIIQLKPNVVALVISHEMQNNGKATAFKELLLSIGYTDKNIISYPNFPDATFTDIEFRALEIKEELENKFLDHKIDYNVTGGNKLMALAFFSQMNVANSDNVIFYVDTSHNVIEFLRPQNKNSVSFDQCLDVKTYLKAYGKTYRSALSDNNNWVDATNERKSLTFWIARNVKKLSHVISHLNKAANDALDKDKQLIHPLQPLNIYQNHYTKELLEKSIDKNIFSLSGDEKNNIIFKNADSVRYIGGGWLEEYAWLVSNELKLHDLKCGVNITDDINHKSDVRNELDLVIVHNNKMLMIEAKTMTFGNYQEKDSNVINKIDSLRNNAGGFFCTALLLSAKPLDHVTKKNKTVHVEDRAKSQKIETLVEDGILELKTYIENWVIS